MIRRDSACQHEGRVIPIASFTIDLDSAQRTWLPLDGTSSIARTSRRPRPCCSSCSLTCPTTSGGCPGRRSSLRRPTSSRIQSSLVAATTTANPDSPERAGAGRSLGSSLPGHWTSTTRFRSANSGRPSTRTSTTRLSHNTAARRSPGGSYWTSDADPLPSPASTHHEEFRRRERPHPGGGQGVRRGPSQRRRRYAVAAPGHPARHALTDLGDGIPGAADPPQRCRGCQRTRSEVRTVPSCQVPGALDPGRPVCPGKVVTFRSVHEQIERRNRHRSARKEKPRRLTRLMMAGLRGRSWPRRYAPIRTRSGSAAKRCASPIAYVCREMSTLNPHGDLPSPRPRLIVLVLAFLSALFVAAAPAHAMMMQVDPQTPCVGHGDNPQSILQAHDATVLRIVLPDFPSPNALRCVERAKAEGYHVYVSLQYDNAWSPTRVASYFARTLPPYAPYAWAVSVGNEQDIVSKQRLAQGVPRKARQCAGSGRRRRCETNDGRVLPAGVERGRAGAGSCHAERSPRVRGDLALGVRLPEGELRDGTAARRAGSRFSLLRHEVGRPPGRPAGRGLGRQAQAFRCGALR